MEHDPLLDFWKQYYPMFYRQAASILRNADIVEDTLQNAILKAWLHRDTLRANTCCRAWLYRIVYNECISHIRRAKRSNVLFADGEYLERLPIDEESVEQHALQLTLHDVVEGMPKKNQDVFRLQYKGYRMVEIAETLQIPLGTVKSRMARAKDMARKHLESMTTQ